MPVSAVTIQSITATLANLLAASRLRRPPNSRPGNASDRCKRGSAQQPGEAHRLRWHGSVRIQRLATATLLLLAPSIVYGAPADDRGAFVQENFAFAARQYAGMLEAVKGEAGTPRTFEHGKIVCVKPEDWTSGFFSGSLWLIHEQTGDEKLKAAAEDYTKRLERIKTYGGTHDLGFMLGCSYGQALRLTGNPAYRDVLLTGAKTLAGRYNDITKTIKSWDGKVWTYPVIIDNMMNLELLTWAARESGERRFLEIAKNHANTTERNHFRPDGSSVHVVDYNPADGSVLKKQTHQGAADDSAWARGQAWGLYGYTMMYRETREPAYLKRAAAIADFLIKHPRLPADGVPYWDFDAPGLPNVPRDSSAAAIMSSALLELAGFVEPGPAAAYRAMAERQLRSLASPAYRAGVGENGNFLLMHATGNHPKNSEIDVPLNYGDYYFLEALTRYVK